MKKIFRLISLFAIVFSLIVGCTGKKKKVSEKENEKEVKVGILHSLSGTMAISEVSLKDALMMGINEINNSGGVLGKKIKPIIVDPASDVDLFAEKAKELIKKDKVAAVFGCWTSASRKSVLPVFEEYKGLLFYPIQYEGEECSNNIIYLGATPNQQLLPAVDFLMSKKGGSKKKFYLLGTDYVFPRTANKILTNYLISKGIKRENIKEEYTPFHHQDYQTIVSKIKSFSASGDACVLNTINGDSNVPFYKELANQGVYASLCPVMAFSIAEDELRTMDTEYLTGHFASWNYYQSIKSPENFKFTESFKKYCEVNKLPGGTERVTDDPICWAYTELFLWKKAVEKAGSFDVSKVIEALDGLEMNSPAGKVKVYGHHLAKKTLIGEIRPDGQFDIVWSTKNNVLPEPFCKYAK